MLLLLLLPLLMTLSCFMLADAAIVLSLVVVSLVVIALVVVVIVAFCP
jgi:hypothetical protein